MRVYLALVLTGVLGLNFAHGKKKDEETCMEKDLDSWSHQYAEKDLGGVDITSIEVKSKRSKSSCKLNKSFGVKGTRMWVHHGCRATFTVCYAAKDLAKETCAYKDLDSWGFGYAMKDIAGPEIASMEVHEKRSKSTCDINKSFGFKGTRMWVHHGCRATFKICYPSVADDNQEDEPVETCDVKDSRQWASKNLQVSSEWQKVGGKWDSSGGKWSASQVLGAPDVFPKSGDLPQAWASKAKGGKEWIEVGFDTPVTPSEINIYETYNPGAVVAIKAKNGDSWVTIWSTSKPTKISGSRVFSPELMSVDFTTSSLRIELDQSAGKSWSEIDAVELVGPTVSGNCGATPKPVDECELEYSRQYASKNLQVSSEWQKVGGKWDSSGGKWSASQVLGAPDVFPKSGDLPQAWASKAKGGKEWIELGYSAPVAASKIFIYETYNPGAVVAIKAKRDNSWVTIWSTDKPEKLSGSRIFSPELKNVDFKISEIRIELDQSASNSWSEIDAVEIVGTVETGECKTTKPQPITTTTRKPTTTTTTTPIPPKTTTTTAPVSGKPIDLAFLIDSSRSISDYQFGLEMDFVSSLTKEFQIGSEDAHVSVVQFAHQVVKSFCFDTYTSDSGLAVALEDRTRLVKGSTKTTKALRYPNKMLFTEDCGAREDASKVVVLVTDGQANNMLTSQQEAQTLKQSGVKVISVGVGASVAQAKRRIVLAVEQDQFTSFATML